MDTISDDTLDGSPRVQRARRFQLLLGSLLLLILAYPYAAALLPGRVRTPTAESTTSGNTSRKTLDFRCPVDVFDEIVALTG